MTRKNATPKGGKRVKLTVFVSEDLHKALRHRCIDEGIAATRLIERLLQEYLKRPPKRKGGT
jgi:hypothetical protein